MRALAFYYLNGRVVPADEVEGVRLLELAADHGDPCGQVELAGRCETGAGVPLDVARARKLLESAAAQGYAPAREALASPR